jgi:hypothetical protein
MPLARDLIVTRHNGGPLFYLNSSMSLTFISSWKGLVSVADDSLFAIELSSLFEGNAEPQATWV